MQHWQREDFAALDRAWMRLAGRGRECTEPAGRSAALDADNCSIPHSVRTPHSETPRCTSTPHSRAWIERPRGHSKTSDIAVQIAWILEFAGRQVTGIAAAADRDQAGLIQHALERIVRANPVLCSRLVLQRHTAFNRETGSRLEIISSDVASSWGALPDFVICDELCHWQSPELWYSLFSCSAKRPDCLLVVLTNAGIGRGWQWEVRQAARNSRFWYFSTLAGPQAPWITQEHLAEQRELLPPPVYERLWLNVWQHSDGHFVTLAEAEACRDETLTMQTRGRPGMHYVATVDYAEKHDYTVGVVVHNEQPTVGDENGQARLIVDRMDVQVPAPGRPVPVAWVQDWMERTAAAFHDVTFIVDEYQLIGTIQKLERRYDVRRFEFRGGRGNHALAMALRKLIIRRQVAWYIGCGAIDTPVSHLAAAASTRDDLETELASLLLKQTQTGRCRIDHARDARSHDDRSFALGAACLHSLEEPQGHEWMQVGEM